MAEQEEEIVIIEDSDAASQESLEEESSEALEESSEEQKRKKILIFGALAILLAILIVAIILIIVIKVKKEHKNKTLSTTTIEQELQTKPKKKIEPSKLEQLIAKANYLYTSGQKEQALKLYEYIAQYSEAISQYNLGVARLKNHQYKAALQSFNQAIANGEKRCVSALNAAVCSLYLKDKKSFRYYIDLAEAYLPNEYNSPLYSYYYTLIHFYRQNYYEALAATKKIEHPEYQDVKNALNAKLAALFDDNYQAIESLENLGKKASSYSKALLYARVGDLVLAKANFEESYLKGEHMQDALMGLVFTKLKMGHIKSAAEDLKKANDEYEEPLKDFPIRVFLKSALFDPLKAQKQYREDLHKSDFILFSKIFYFSPYKIFNANKTIDYIRKGNATSYIDNIDSAESFLQKSASTSSVNKGIAVAIKKALHFKIREANAILKKLVKIQPKHSILHYNLALTYAQLGDMQNAYKHFIWSYHLDAKNYLPGIYAYMASKLINKEDLKLLQILKESLANEDESEKIDFYNRLLDIAQHQYLNGVDWLNNSYKTRPIYLIVTNIVARHLNHDKEALKSAKELIALLPHEILPHLIYIDTKYAKDSEPLYAKEMTKYLKKQKFNYKDLFYGPYLTRYMFIQTHLITGQLYKLVKKLQHELSITTSNDIIDMQQALALTLFYNQNFEESYVLYNQLIDEEKIRDAKTLFLGSVAAIAANHHPNAIALLELSKLKDRRFLETRYALALLYLEVNNPRGAQIDFANMNTNNFHSRYFNFDIDTKKLTFYHQHPNAK